MIAKLKENPKAIILLIMLLIVISIGISYAYWRYSVMQTNENKLTSSCLNITLTEESDAINLEKAYPITDEEGMNLTPYTFTIKNTCDSSISYEVALGILEESDLSSSYIAAVLDTNEIKKLNEYPEVEIEGYKEGRLLQTGSLSYEEEKTYSLRIWMDESVTPEDVEAMNKALHSKIVITASINKDQIIKEEYKETILNGADPIIKDELIPVTIDSDGTVKKADIGSEWYSYEKKNWANAIILKDETEDYLAGEVIPEDAIESYFVWIPKYRYQLWDLGQYNSLTTIDESKVHKIPIIFGDYNTSDSKENECTTPMESGETGNCQVGDYMTHPAFLSIPSTGFWVGKFETGTILTSDYNVRNGEAIQIKPNVSSWRNIQVANAFYTTYDYKRNLDSHMMKNTEWGAVAYLQHSKYGSATSVRINNNSSYITGYQANNEPTCGWTNTNEECNKQCNDDSCNIAYPNSVLASTTGNISGIYDMSGGSHEYVMGVILDQNNKPMSGRNSKKNSGFNGPFGCPTCDNDTSGLTELTNGYDFPDSKYFDVYFYNDSYGNYEKRILGDATAEMGPFSIQTFLTNSNQIGSWYNDVSWFAWNTHPWITRGFSYTGGLNAGLFAFNYYYGDAIYNTFRLILSPV